MRGSSLSPRTQQTGLSLIEVMVVLAIIAILAAVAIPIYIGYESQAEASEAFTLTTDLRSRMVEFMSANSACPQPGDTGFASVSQLQGQYVASVSIGGHYPADGDGPACTISATFARQGVAPGLRGGTITLQAVLHGQSSISWTCRSNNVPQMYVPTGCNGA